MEASFIKVRDIIINVNTIESIRAHGQFLLIECTNNTHHVYFSSDFEVEEELNRIYSLIK